MPFHRLMGHGYLHPSDMDGLARLLTVSGICGALFPPGAAARSLPSPRVVSVSWCRATFWRMTISSVQTLSPSKVPHRCFESLPGTAHVPPRSSSSCFKGGFFMQQIESKGRIIFSRSILPYHTSYGVMPAVFGNTMFMFSTLPSRTCRYRTWWRGAQSSSTTTVEALFLR